ncbi:hypothetical protein [Cellulomonas citrea]|uniref:hypothetical protein n=1 Tax=Cellulomonas citrea TaxID=1909423 RepID=UPI001357A6FB|nr:hypothetical protein [Cellulomonas citrea]
MPAGYEDHVAELEAGIGEFGFRSMSASLVKGGRDSFEYYSEVWRTSEGEAKLRGRTPVSLDRDRILYSDEFRRQDEKYHVLFIGGSRLARNYTTHALRAAHVARSVANRLKLNSELVEAIVLGSKVGGVPFVHRGKRIVADWVKAQIKAQDSHDTDKAKRPRQGELLKAVPSGSGLPLVPPDWVDQIESDDLRRKVDAYLPWARGWSNAPAYSTGQESYWALTTNPFLHRSKESAYLAQTMYGVWRHSLGDPEVVPSAFEHSISLSDEPQTIRQEHGTHEAMLARYCDDITWVLENLSEASRVAALEGEQTAHQRLGRNYGHEFEESVKAALVDDNTGKLYTYFIDDLVRTSQRNMTEATPGTVSEVEPVVTLSKRGALTLTLMKQFLESDIFSRERILSRNLTLDGIIVNALEVLYKPYKEVGYRLIERHSRLEGWNAPDLVATAKSGLDDPVRRVQTTVDLLMGMSDRDVFELVGLE